MFEANSFAAGVLVGMFVLGLLYVLSSRMPEEVTEPVKKVAKKIIPLKMPGEEFCECLKENNIKGFDGVKVEAYSYKVGNSTFTRVNEDKAIQNLVEANSKATVQDALNASKCIIEQIKKADKKLESLKYSDKPAYIQKVLASFIQNDCFLQILKSVDEDLVTYYEEGLYKMILSMEKEYNDLEKHLDPSFKKKTLPEFVSMHLRN